jgi:hypothetical protein
MREISGGRREKDEVDEMDGANGHPEDDERVKDKLSRAVERRKVENSPSRERAIIYDDRRRDSRK